MVYSILSPKTKIMSEEKKPVGLGGYIVGGAALIAITIFISVTMRPSSGNLKKLSVVDSANWVVDTPECVYQLHTHGPGFIGPLVRATNKDNHKEVTYNILLPDSTKPVIDSVTKKPKKDAAGNNYYYPGWFEINKNYVWVVPFGSN